MSCVVCSVYMVLHMCDSGRPICVPLTLGEPLPRQIQSSREPLIASQKVVLHVEASAGKGMLPGICVRQLNHVTTKQLLEQGAIRIFGMEMRRVSHTEKADASHGLRRMEFHTREDMLVPPWTEVWVEPAAAPPKFSECAVDSL